MPPEGGGALHRELAQVLRTGPFSAALHLAIESTGLTLDQLQGRLLARGIVISLATLSYWRRGRSRPERPESLRAVTALEEILALPPGALTALLGRRRPRGRTADRPRGSLGFDRLWESSEPLTSMLAQLSLPPHGAVVQLGLHTISRFDAQRRVVSITVRELLRANTDRVARRAAIFHAEEQHDAPPVLAETRYCRPGRVRTDRGTGLVVGELILDRMMSTGDAALVEYRWDFPRPFQMLDYEYRLRDPIRELVIVAEFTRPAVPARCYRYIRRAAEAPEDSVKELWIGASDAAQSLDLDVPAGIVGMRWDWNDEQDSAIC